MVSAIILEQAESEIPVEKENTNLAANINSQLFQIDRKEVMIEITLQAIMILILPFYKILPLIREPTPRPATERVDRIMLLEFVSSSVCHPS